MYSITLFLLEEFTAEHTQYFNRITFFGAVPSSCGDLTFIEDFKQKPLQGQY